MIAYFLLFNRVRIYETLYETLIDKGLEHFVWQFILLKSTGINMAKYPMYTNIYAILTYGALPRNNCILLPDSLDNLFQIARTHGFPLKGAIFNLDGVFDSKKNRKQAQPQERQTWHRKDCLIKLFMLRIMVERAFAWKDKFKRLLFRFEKIQSRHFTFKLLAYTMVNMRQFRQP